MTEENLDQKILSWLNTQGYGVEMKVATSLSAAGCEVSQSGFYNDPETGISREIDVVGRMSDAVGLLYIYSVIECKKSSKPWVLFTSDQAMFNRIFAFAITTDKTRRAIFNHIQHMLEIDWFRKDGQVAYGITEAFTSKEDTTFKAGMTATKAAIAFLKRETDQTGPDFLRFFFPTVVLDGRLFECYLGAASDPILREVDSAFLLFPIRLSEHVGASVRIVTLRAFNSYCEELTSVYHALRRELAEEIDRVAASLGIESELLNEMRKDNHNWSR